MSDPAVTSDEAAELRALQARVYSRDAEATPAEIERLHELQNRRRRASAPAVRTRSAAASALPTAPPGNTPDSEAAERIAPDVLTPAPAATPVGEERAGSTAPAGGQAADPPAPAPRRLRGAIIGAALVLAGLVVGLLIPRGALESGPALTDEQRERAAQIAEQEHFDEGSMTLVGEQEDVRVWAATLMEGAVTCVVADTRSDHSTACMGTQAFQAGEVIAVAHTSGDPETVGFEAYLSQAIDGGLIARINRVEGGFVAEPDWLSQFPDSMRPIAEQFVEEGFEAYSLQLVGEFRGDSIWAGTRGFPEEQCLILTGSLGDMHCEPGPQVRMSGLTLEVRTGYFVSHEFVLNYTNWGQPYLSIRELEVSLRG